MMKRGIPAVCLCLGLVFTSIPSHAFLDNIFGTGKTPAGRTEPVNQAAEGQVGNNGNAQPAASVAAAADTARYVPIEYVNADSPGPALVVLPGEIRSSNAVFTGKFGPNNIADFAELELTRANFKVLERTGLGPMLREVRVAYSLGDPQEASNAFKRGKFKTTEWLVTFDILKAESVAKASKGFDARAVGQVAGMLLFGPVGVVAAAAVGSVKANEAAEVWLVGMRYTIIDAKTAEQVATGYVEDKMGLGAKSSSVLGRAVGESGGLTLDDMVQRLVQSCVAEIDSRYKKVRVAVEAVPVIADGEIRVDDDQKLARLFDPVKVKQLDAMFPDKQWPTYVDRAERNGLADMAMVSRGQFNPYLAALWWWKAQHPATLTWEQCKQKLANNLPARSRGAEYLLTGTSKD
jgi:hypothetical protein